MQGTIEVRENNNPNVRGFLRGTNKWVWEKNRQAIIPNFVMYYDDIQSFLDNPTQIQLDINEFIQGHGFTGFHIPSVAGRWFDTESSNKVIDEGYENPDPRSFEALELLISMTYQAGGAIHIWPWGDDSRSWTPTFLSGGINGPEDKRLQRYIAARLGPIPGWSMGYGFDVEEWAELSEMIEWRDYMQDKCGWFHHFGTRYPQPNSGINHSGGIAWNQAMDYASWEHHKPSYEVFTAAMDALPSIPSFSEDRFRIRWNSNRAKDLSRDGSDTRSTLWYGAMAGGAAGIWGNLTENDLGKSEPYPNKEELRTFATFFSKPKHFSEDSEPEGVISTQISLYSPSQQSYVVYRENTESILLDLSSLSQTQRAYAVNTKQPYREIPLGTYSPSGHTISLPEVSDWALVLGPEEVVAEFRLGVNVLLEGFLDFGSGAMHTRLNQAGVIPLSQPFGESAFAYAGDEQLGSIPPYMVDWVLVELWDSLTNEVLYRKAAVLSNFGLIFDLDGQPGVLFEDIPDRAYLVAIRARGHLSIISSQTFRLSPANQTLNVYDFASASEQARGTEQLKLTLGGFALYAGDYNGDGILNNQDFNLWRQNASRLDVYFPADGDGNSIINNLDFNLWNSNGSKIGDPILNNP